QARQVDGDGVTVERRARPQRRRLALAEVEEGVAVGAEGVDQRLRTALDQGGLESILDGVARRGVVRGAVDGEGEQRRLLRHGEGVAQRDVERVALAQGRVA